MREHKYRAWSEKNKMMYYSHRPDGSDNPVWSWDVVFRKDWHDGKGAEDNGAIKMECIGLRDRNKTDIYEGDIFKAFNLLSPTLEVIYKSGCFGYEAEYMEFIPLKNSNFDWANGKSDKIEIVGNRFENPELVK